MLILSFLKYHPTCLDTLALLFVSASLAKSMMWSITVIHSL
jgi:hypothetical protein